MPLKVKPKKLLLSNVRLSEVDLYFISNCDYGDYFCFPFRFLFRFFHQGRGDVTALLLHFSRGLLGPNPVTRWVKARVHPGWVASSSQDPYWWQRLPHRVPTAHQEQFWGTVSCSRTLQHVAQFCPGELGFESATFQSLVHQLYPLRYSRPSIIIFTSCTYMEQDEQIQIRLWSLLYFRL